jgi:transcriptional regulator of arginine metabolism
MKLARQAEILKLIHEYDIETQEELARKLEENGFEVTQATVSRDIREMKLTKVTGENGHLRYTLLQNQAQDTAGRYVRVLKDAVLGMDTADNLLVVKTVAGMAMAAAAVIDEMNWGEIVGCIAGDNTIFCAVRSREEAIRVMDKLRKMLETF